MLHLRHGLRRKRHAGASATCSISFRYQLDVSHDLSTTRHAARHTRQLSDAWLGMVSTDVSHCVISPLLAGEMVISAATPHRLPCSSVAQWKPDVAFRPDLVPSARSTFARHLVLANESGPGVAKKG